MPFPAYLRCTGQSIRGGCSLCMLVSLMMLPHSVFREGDCSAAIILFGFGLVLGQSLQRVTSGVWTALNAKSESGGYGGVHESWGHGSNIAKEMAWQARGGYHASGLKGGVCRNISYFCGFWSLYDVDGSWSMALWASWGSRFGFLQWRGTNATTCGRPTFAQRPGLALT